MVDGVNGVDLTLPRQDLGRMNTDLEDTVNNETYTCLGTCVKPKIYPVLELPNICMQIIVFLLKRDLEHGVIFDFLN